MGDGTGEETKGKKVPKPLWLSLGSGSQALTSANPNTHILAQRHHPRRRGRRPQRSCRGSALPTDPAVQHCQVQTRTFWPSATAAAIIVVDVVVVDAISREACPLTGHAQQRPLINQRLQGNFAVPASLPLLNVPFLSVRVHFKDSDIAHPGRDQTLR